MARCNRASVGAEWGLSGVAATAARLLGFQQLLVQEPKKPSTNPAVLATVSAAAERQMRLLEAVAADEQRNQEGEQGSSGAGLGLDVELNAVPPTVPVSRFIHEPQLLIALSQVVAQSTTNSQKHAERKQSLEQLVQNQNEQIEKLNETIDLLRTGNTLAETVSGV